MFHAHADYDDGGVDKDAAGEEVLVKVMMEKMIGWKMPHPNMMTLRQLLFLGMTSRAQLCRKNFIYS